MPKKTPKPGEAPALRAVRWIPDQPCVYDRANIVGTSPIVFSHGTVIGVGEPLGESDKAISEDFALNLIAAGHAQACEVVEGEAEAVLEHEPVQ